MSILLELTAQIVSKHASKTSMSTEQLLRNMRLIHAALKSIEEGSPSDQAPEQQPEEPGSPALTVKQAFKKDEVICMVCNKGGFKTLKRHLSIAHDLKPGEYRRQFGIPSRQKLASKSYIESRRQMAIDRNLGDGLAKARESRAANKADIPQVGTKASVPAVRKKASTPAVKDKATFPSVRKKSPVPAVKVKAAVPAKVEGKKGVQGKKQRDKFNVLTKMAM